MSNDTIRIMCPNITCRRVLAVPISARGRTVKCRFCAMSIKIPLAKPAPTPPPAEADQATENDEQESTPRKAG